MFSHEARARAYSKRASSRHTGAESDDNRVRSAKRVPEFILDYDISCISRRVGPRGNKILRKPVIKVENVRSSEIQALDVGAAVLGSVPIAGSPLEVGC